MLKNALTVCKVLSLSILVVCFIHYENVKWYFDEFDSRAHHEQLHTDLYNITARTLALLDGHVTVWAIAGTALGAARHQSLIPWDDDVDFGYFMNDTEKLKQLNWTGSGLRFVSSAVGFLVFNMYLSFKSLKNPGILELFQCRDRDGLVEYATPARNYWPHETLRWKKLFPLKKGAFGPLLIPVANDLDEQCRRAFGPFYMTHAKVKLNHGARYKFLWLSNPFILLFHPGHVVVYDNAVRF